jgi:hypothetical protein
MAFTTILATFGLGVVVAGTAAAETTRHLNLTLTGAPINANENVYAVRGPGFRGALDQVVKMTWGIVGTDTATTYDRFGSVTAVDKFSLQPADTKLTIISVKGSGHYVRGTGLYKHIRGHYMFSGTEDLRTHLIKIHLTGTEVF